MIIIDTQINLDEELSKIYIKYNIDRKDEMIQELREKLNKATRVDLK